MARVLAAGVFDLLHYGHLRYLEEAKRQGGKGAELIVVVARDSTVLKRKGRLPVLKEEHRRALVEGLKPVDKAVLGELDVDMEKVIRDVKPDIIALGYDQEDLSAVAKPMGIKVVRIGKYGEISSSTIRSLINPAAVRGEGPSAEPGPRP
jgi:FAD synthetase